MGWVLSWVFVLLIACVEMTTCTMGSEDAWRVSLYLYAPAALVLLAGMAITKKHHIKYLWLSLPSLVILGLCALVVGKYLIGATFQGNHLCTVATGEAGFNEYQSSWLQVYWAPFQLLVVTGYLVFIAKCWKLRAKYNVEENHS